VQPDRTSLSVSTVTFNTFRRRLSPVFRLPGSNATRVRVRMARHHPILFGPSSRGKDDAERQFQCRNALRDCGGESQRWA